MKNKLVNIGLGAMFVLAILLRYAGLPFISVDMARDFISWFQLLANGGYKALILPVFSYTPPYLYLLYLSTFTRSFLSDVIAIKLISIFFDAINSLLVYKIVRINFPAGKIPILAAALFALAPSVILNSAYWGQVDSFYTCFLLACLYYMLKDRPFLAMLFFAVAFAIKAQASFLGPFMVLMFLRKRIHWIHFGLVPIVYLVLFIPIIIIGKPVLTTLGLYSAQVGSFNQASMNAPNLYVFVRPAGYPLALPVGLGITIILIFLWLLIYARRYFKLTNAVLVYLALVSVACCPFLLPRMHDRYFYPADVFSIVLAFFMPELWFVAVSYQVISVLVYSINLLQLGLIPNLVVATAMNTGIIIILLLRQVRLCRNEPGRALRKQLGTDAINQ
jgi:Gpi18-like mannosyltransferase